LSFLDNKNVIFGRVISGMSTLSKLGDWSQPNETVDKDVELIDSGKFTLS